MSHDKTIHVTRIETGWKVKVDSKILKVGTIEELSAIFKEYRDQKKYDVKIENVQKIN